MYTSIHTLRVSWGGIVMGKAFLAWRKYGSRAGINASGVRPGVPFKSVTVFTFKYASRETVTLGSAAITPPVAAFTKSLTVALSWIGFDPARTCIWKLSNSLRAAEISTQCSGPGVAWGPIFASEPVTQTLDGNSLYTSMAGKKRRSSGSACSEADATAAEQHRRSAPWRDFISYFVQTAVIRAPSRSFRSRKKNWT